jgi:hypothetical protein
MVFAGRSTLHVPLERRFIELFENLHCRFVERQRDLEWKVSIDLEAHAHTPIHPYAHVNIIGTMVQATSLVALGFDADTPRKLFNSWFFGVGDQSPSMPLKGRAAFWEARTRPSTSSAMRVNGIKVAFRNRAVAQSTLHRHVVKPAGREAAIEMAQPGRDHPDHRDADVEGGLIEHHEIETGFRSEPHAGIDLLTAAEIE